MKFTNMQKHRICLFLAILMILSGVCPENRSHSSFAWKKLPKTASITTAAPCSLTNSDCCPEELIGLRSIRNTVRLVQSRVKSTKTDFSKRILFWSYLAVLPVIFHTILQKKEYLCAAQTSTHFALIAYIHHQDGAKG